MDGCDGHKCEKLIPDFSCNDNQTRVLLLNFLIPSTKK